MTTSSYRKRLDRIEHGLRRPVDDNGTVKIVGPWFGVRDVDQAISRARKARATSVVFVPANGDDVQLAGCEQPDPVPFAIAVAYEMAEPAGADYKNPLACCTEKQLRRIAALDTAPATESAPGEVPPRSGSVERL